MTQEEGCCKREEEKRMQEERIKQKLEEEPKINEMKLEIKMKIKEKKDIIMKRENQVHFKPRKLAITKFEGLFLGWF